MRPRLSTDADGRVAPHWPTTWMCPIVAKTRFKRRGVLSLPVMTFVYTNRSPYPGYKYERLCPVSSLPGWTYCAPSCLVAGDPVAPSRSPTVRSGCVPASRPVCAGGPVQKHLAQRHRSACSGSVPRLGGAPYPLEVSYPLEGRMSRPQGCARCPLQVRLSVPRDRPGDGNLGRLVHCLSLCSSCCWRPSCLRPRSARSLHGTESFAGGTRRVLGPVHTYMESGRTYINLAHRSGTPGGKPGDEMIENRGPQRELCCTFWLHLATCVVTSSNINEYY